MSQLRLLGQSPLCFCHFVGFGAKASASQRWFSAASRQVNLAGPFKARSGTENRNRVALATHENRVFSRR
jgi:hypothetical protein